MGNVAAMVRARKKNKHQAPVPMAQQGLCLTNRHINAHAAM
jgi:hypothetical protein